jgi:hypothetical protein
MRSFRLAAVLVALSLSGGVAAGCNGSPTSASSKALPGEEVFTLYVASHTASCTGEGVRTCMLVRYDANAAWQYFYDGIEGFTYEPGFEYRLTVASRDVPNPPADGSSKKYRLLQIVSKQPAL